MTHEKLLHVTRLSNLREGKKLVTVRSAPSEEDMKEHHVMQYVNTVLWVCSYKYVYSRYCYTLLYGE